MQLNTEIQIRSAQEAIKAMTRFTGEIGLLGDDDYYEKYQKVIEKILAHLRIQLKTKIGNLQTADDFIKQGNEVQHANDLRSFVNIFLMNNFSEANPDDRREFFIVTSSTNEDGIEQGVASGIIEGNQVTDLDFFVGKEKRKRGVGTALHKKIMEALKERGIHSIETVEIDKNDEETNSFMKKMGYERIENRYRLEIK